MFLTPEEAEKRNLQEAKGYCLSLRHESELSISTGNPTHAPYEAA